MKKKLLITKDIQNEKERYIFLTDDEQDVNREIKEIIIDDDKVRKEIGAYIFKDLYFTKKYKYQNNYDFDFNRKIDNEEVDRQNGSIGLHIITHAGDDYNASEQEIIMKSRDNQEVIVKLGNNDKYIELIEEALKIDEYIKKKR